MELTTKYRFLQSTLNRAVAGSSMNVRDIAEAAHATPSLLYYHFDSLAELEATARKVGLATMFAQDVGHQYLAHALGSLPKGAVTGRGDDREGGIDQGVVVGREQLAWLRRNVTFIEWLFGGDDILSVFDVALPGAIDTAVFGGACVNLAVSNLAAETIAAWVGLLARCEESILVETLSWADVALAGFRYSEIQGSLFDDFLVVVASPQ